MEKIIYVSSQEELLVVLSEPEKDNDILSVIISYLVVHNLGLALLKETINYHNKNNLNITICTSSSLPYLILAIESGFENIITSLEDKEFKKYESLAITKNYKLFNISDNLFEYFKNSN